MSLPLPYITLQTNNLLINCNKHIGNLSLMSQVQVMAIARLNGSLGHSPVPK